MLYDTHTERLPIPEGPLYLEIEPGHCVDLKSVIEWDDTPKKDTLLLLLPAPTIEKRLPGPHGVVVSGQARQLALRYLRTQAARTTAWLDTLPEVPDLGSSHLRLV